MANGSTLALLGSVYINPCAARAVYIIYGFKQVYLLIKYH